MGRRGKSKRSDGPKGDEWMATYSDCITLLLTLFVLLYSMSSIDAEKTKRISQAFNQVMLGERGDSILEYDLYDGKVPLVGGETDINNDLLEGGEQAQMYTSIENYVKENGLSDTVYITEDERGVILQLKDSILFETGKASLKDSSKNILNKINRLISTMPNSIIVEGHTDNIPISRSDFPSNWELSTARAVTVVRYFTEEKKQNPTRFSAQGYGEYKPLVPNTSDKNRAKNRRVNILVVTNNKE